MPQKTPTSIASYIYQLAKEHNITATRDNISNIATAITTLSGDDIELDDVEQLLVNLKRKGFLTKAEILQFEGRYLREQKHSRTE
ncbi:hypothetical protein [Citrobacter freundii]|uniref:hypothetical protein n=1 Tax=Citrobacter freundii TaxID=546 RepID=UPI000B40AECD|nr:hypothetical protein [Citrobacter freundii]HAV1559381.1 hypothetical protein [Enterobacter hormaechei subsp. steigerwaltii]HDG1099545.1 hypothetical protein [Klebsiella aerogenes]HED5893607.1 hypothetical protein [Salmonella enterica]EKW1654925.1 hypothetical protein [Citrobacter freundii]HAV1560392.1 hypothetical protein [Enterobacter hormaechei subsp. steigerwaltii]